MALELRLVQVEGFTWKKAKKTGEVPVVKLTISIPVYEEDGGPVHAMLDFINAGHTRWKIDAVEQE